MKSSIAAVVAILVLVGIFGGVAGGEPSAEPAAQAFLLAWTDGQYRSAAAMTTGAPAVVTTALRTAYQQLGAAAFYLTMGPITQHGGTAQASFHASVDLGQDGAPWNYTGRFTLHKTPAGWRVLWSPAVINPGLRPGLRMAVVSKMPARAPLLDAAGKPLVRASAAYIAAVRPGKLRNMSRTATAFAEATGLDSTQVKSVISAAPKAGSLTLVTLDPATYSALRRKLAAVPGLIVHRARRRLFNSLASGITGSVGTEVAKVLQQQGVTYRPGTTVGLSGLESVYQRTLAGTADTEVVAENRAGRPVAVLADWPSHRGGPVTTTIDATAQRAAAKAAGAQSSPAAVVAIQATNGHILAVGGNKVRGQPVIDPLAGHYQPGQAFTIVSGASLLSTGLNARTPIPCTSSTNVGGRTFTNVPAEPSLGSSPPFTSDFAHACGTAFTGLSRLLNGQKLNQSAASFGLGAGWKLPLAAFSGSFHAAKGEAGLAADTIGQGGVEVSPLAMALVAGGVDAGVWHPPSLITNPPDPGLTPKAVAAAQTLGTLRQLMRATVTSGAARQANLHGTQVYGQVGHARETTGSRWWANWFVGYRGGVAFAALELTRSPSGSAVPLATSFLRGLGG
ncbi:MAG TPA: NTF2-like N-terminal transpeptidase domain-containing protein [Streptosporangiaceae bacterium]|nr:NTF2-like N-terminal transpeptidase domain-containing protein [Streptosporangiaceae bacterium]